MAIGNRFDFTSEAVQRAMIASLLDSIRCEIKARIMERIAADVDAAASAAAETFRASIEALWEPANGRETLRVLIERRDVLAANRGRS
ncbi:hypothetical protein ACQR1I_16585 [Bradyrhizobium sp. HKCCYLS2038]|uniref:hypothetical protein n=1 Tax=unclassified Bradyrhizobium TaxID=2631580 RepID=UPI003EB7A03F